MKASHGRAAFSAMLLLLLAACAPASSLGGGTPGSFSPAGLSPHWTSWTISYHNTTTDRLTATLVKQKCFANSTIALASSATGSARYRRTCSAGASSGYIDIRGPAGHADLFFKRTNGGAVTLSIFEQVGYNLAVPSTRSVTISSP